MEVLHPGQTIPLLLYNTGVCFLKLDLSDLTRYFFEIERSFVYGERIRCQHYYPIFFQRISRRLVYDPEKHLSNILFTKFNSLKNSSSYIKI